MTDLYNAEWLEHPMSLDDIIDQCLDDSHMWFPRTAEDVAFLALCTAGEIGELCNLVKKTMRGTHTSSDLQSQMEEELTDAFIYLMNIVGLWRHQGFDLVKSYQAKRATNEQRFSPSLRRALNTNTQELPIVEEKFL